MAVPAHDERDFEFAQKYNIPITQSIAPLFGNTTPAALFREDKKTVHRHITYSIIYNPKTEKYLILDLLT
jgi:leucyl-tRNA synthetase